MHEIRFVMLTPHGLQKQPILASESIKKLTFNKTATFHSITVKIGVILGKLRCDQRFFLNVRATREDNA